jgi:large subunit ribosomal protein L47
MLERMKTIKPKNFKSFWEYEMQIGERPLQEEVLRSHVRNWKSLNLKQRKIILGFLNARRSKDAKAAFIKELKILGDKIAQDQVKERIDNAEAKPA